MNFEECAQTLEFYCNMRQLVIDTSCESTIILSLPLLLLFIFQGLEDAPLAFVSIYLAVFAMIVYWNIKFQSC